MASTKESQAPSKDKAEKKVGPSPNHPRPRKGKTARDRANGAKAKNLQNKDMRASWQGDSKRSAANFPSSSCNGKRNRYQWTGKGNETCYADSKRK